MKTLEIWVLTILAVFAPIKAVLITALVLVIADLLTGVAAAYKRGEMITSAGLKQSIVKAVVYELALILGYIAEHYLIGNALPATNVVGALIGITELKSCLENLDSIYGAPIFRSIIKGLVDKDEKKT